MFAFQHFSIRSKVSWRSSKVTTFDDGRASSEHAGGSVQVSVEGEVEKK